MPFFVVVTLHVREERLSDVLALIRAEFARPHGGGPGRRRAFVFQRFDRPTELLGCIEWDSQAAYDAYRRSATHRAILDSLAAPSHTRYCTRLMSFERISEPSPVAACGMMTTGTSPAAEVEALLVGQVRTEMLASPGLVVFDVYRTLKQPPRFVVLHRWRQRADLERFLQVTAPRLSQQLVEVGATVERFTGILAAELPAEL